jgi:hypothetical protein
MPLVADKSVRSLVAIWQHEYVSVGKTVTAIYDQFLPDDVYGKVTEC